VRHEIGRPTKIRPKIIGRWIFSFVWHRLKSACIYYPETR